MTPTRFYARPIRNDETGRWTVDTNIEGLFIEAATEAECREVVAEFAPELIAENHGVAVVPVRLGTSLRSSDLAWSLSAPA